MRRFLFLDALKGEFAEQKLPIRGQLEGFLELFLNIVLEKSGS
jgi:hypothetical protein